MALVGRLLAFLIALALLALAIDLAVSNSHLVEVRLWIAGSSGLEMPTWLLVLGCFVAGLILGALAMLAPLTRSAWQKRQLRSRIRKLEAEPPGTAGGATGDTPRLPGA